MASRPSLQWICTFFHSPFLAVERPTNPRIHYGRVPTNQPPREQYRCTNFPQLGGTAPQAQSVRFLRIEHGRQVSMPRRHPCSPDRVSRPGYSRTATASDKGLWATSERDMCGRFTLRASASEIAAYFELMHDLVAWDKPRFNIARTQSVLAVRVTNAGREAVRLHWGLIPPWEKDSKRAASLVNARSETVAKLPSFRAAYRDGR